MNFQRLSLSLSIRAYPTISLGWLLKPHPINNKQKNYKYKMRLLTFLLCLCASFSFSALSLANEELLEVNKAFRFSARTVDSKTIEVRYDIAEDYYLYRNKLKFELAPASIKLGPPQLPAGKIKNDDYFGEVEIYRGTLIITLPIISSEEEVGVGAKASTPEKSPTEAGTTKPNKNLTETIDSVTLNATSQGCADLGVCYPPNTQSAKLPLTQFSADPSLSGSSATSGSPATETKDESSRIAKMLKNAGFWAIIAGFFGSGLLLAFTPCVFPMIPILSGIIVGHGHNITKGRAFILSSVYVLGMALTYAIAGVAAGLSGSLLSTALQNVWVLGGFAAVFVALSLSMFGFYELQLPTFLQSKVSDEANKQKSGSLHGVALMGALSAVIVGPCVAAPLAGALLYIAQTRDAVLGGTALFFMALGMGAPLIAVGVSARHLLPHTGPWMEAVKKFFGVMLLGLAIWLVSPVIPPAAHLLAWGALAIVSAIYLRAIDPVAAHAHGWARFWKGIGVILLLAGAALVIGALGGSRDPLQPLGFLRLSNLIEPAIKVQRVKTVAELDAQLKNTKQPVMLDFYADWCTSCKELERHTFTDPRVQAQLSKMLVLKADVTEGNEADKALMRRFGVYAPPVMVFFDQNGKQIDDVRITGYMPPNEFLKNIESIH